MEDLKPPSRFPVILNDSYTNIRVRLIFKPQQTAKDWYVVGWLGIQHGKSFLMLSVFTTNRQVDKSVKYEIFPPVFG